MGVGKSKIEKKKQSKSSAYMVNAGGGRTGDIKNRDRQSKNNEVLARTKGYDKVQGEYKEKRGRKRKK